MTSSQLSDPTMIAKPVLDPDALPATQRRIALRYVAVEKILRLVDWLGGEWMLRTRPNSGSVVFLRALLVAIYVFVFALWLKSVIDPSRTWQPSMREAQIAVGEHLPWLGAIFAASYTGFYARYASQWSYIAGLYNQIMAAASTSPTALEKNASLLNWHAAFIEDCYYLHLDRKPVFAFLIKQMLQDDVVLNTFIDCTPPEIVKTVLARNDISPPAT